MVGIKSETATQVATVLTVYGIETATYTVAPPTNTLQQYLPFTVLKLIKRWNI